MISYNDEEKKDPVAPVAEPQTEANPEESK